MELILLVAIIGLFERARVRIKQNLSFILAFCLSGPSFGLNGYMLWARNKSNHCGVANAVSNIHASSYYAYVAFLFISLDYGSLRTLNQQSAASCMKIWPKMGLKYNL